MEQCANETKEQTDTQCKQTLIFEQQQSIEQVNDVFTDIMVRLNTIRKNAEIIKKHADHYAALATSDKDYSEMVDYYSRVLVKDLEKMEEIREDVDEVREIHPYCEGCNHRNGPHPSQSKHMGSGGCLV